jgi:hypothetical protein
MSDHVCLAYRVVDDLTLEPRLTEQISRNRRKSARTQAC